MTWPAPPADGSGRSSGQDPTAPLSDPSDAGDLQRWTNAGRLVGSAAHDVRSALAGAQANLEYLTRQMSRREASEAQLLEAARDARIGIERALAAARNLDEVARVRGKPGKRAIARQVVDRAAASVECLFRSSVELSIEAKPVPPVLADPSLLHQALVQMLLDASEPICETRCRGGVKVAIAAERGRVRIGVETRLEDPDPRVAAPEPRRNRLGFSLGRAVARELGGELSVGEAPEGAFSGAVLWLQPAPDPI